MPDPEFDLRNSHKRRMQRLAHICKLTTPKEDGRQRQKCWLPGVCCLGTESGMTLP